VTNTHHSTHRIAHDHPCLPGHFPGNPIVPGVLLLEQVAQATAAWLGETMHIRQFSHIKFLSPLRPEDELEVFLSGTPPQLHFRCESAGRLLAQGSFST
jgi:3-hydroxyacyl-[acyl-carrier-protein] dehydratase